MVENGVITIHHKYRTTFSTQSVEIVYLQFSSFIFYKFLKPQTTLLVIITILNGHYINIMYVMSE